MHSSSLIDIGKSIIKNKSSFSQELTIKNPIRKQFLKKIELESSFKRENEKNNSYNNIYPLTNKKIHCNEFFTPKKKTNFKKIENYLLSASLLSKNEHNESSFDIEYFKNISKKYSPLVSKRSIISSFLTKNTKETYKKNMLIQMIKKKREEILLNEKEIQHTFRLRKKEIDGYFHNFSIIRNEYKTIQRKKDIILNYYQMVHQKVRSKFIIEEINNKRLKDTIEKTIRDIYKLKDYAHFINELYNMPFVMDKIDDNLFYGNKFDVLCEKIINLYNEEELENENNENNKMLKDIQLFIQNYNSYEDKIIQLLKEKETIIKETYLLKKQNRDNLKYLIKRKNNYENDENSLMDIKEKCNKENNFQVNETEDFYSVLKNIQEIANIVGINISKNPKDNTIPDYLKYCKDILSNLRSKECLIDKYTKEIENIIKSQNKNDKALIEKMISNRKKFNLSEKQHLIKITQEKKNELNKIKTINKIKKKIVKGRYLVDYKNINIHKKKVIKKIENKDEKDKELIYFLSDEDII